MSVEATTYAELTQPFRWIDRVDPAILAAHPLARSVEAVTPVSTVLDLEVIAVERNSLLSPPRRRFLLTVEGADYITASDFAGSAPAAMLKCERFGLSGAGRRVLIVKFEVDYGANVTRLLVWG